MDEVSLVQYSLFFTSNNSVAAVPYCSVYYLFFTSGSIHCSKSLVVRSSTISLLHAVVSNDFYIL